MSDKIYFAFRGDARDMAQLSTISDAEHRSMGAQVRLAIREWLEEYARKRGEIDSEKGAQR